MMMNHTWCLCSSPTVVRACKSAHECIREEKACNLDYSRVEDVHECD